MWMTLNYLYIALRAHLYEFVKEEKGAVDIVAIVVLIGIAVVLALVFRESIETLLETLLNTITEGATKAVKE